MKVDTIKELNALNKKFYQKRAQNFSDTRAVAWAGWEQVLEKLSLIEKEPENILDVGCGNGRFVQFLMDSAVEFSNYLGVDSSSELVKIAVERYENNKNVKFKMSDILREGEFGKINGQYDLIIAFGLMHHIPGSDIRLKLIKDLVGKLAEDGNLVLTFWQFRKSKRFDNMILPIQDFEFKNDLEEGDYLLDWDKSGLPRYCHNFSDQEIENLVDDLKRAGIEIMEEYDADGKEGNLNHYLILSYAEK